MFSKFLPKIVVFLMPFVFSTFSFAQLGYTLVLAKKIYLVDSAFRTAEAMVIKDGKIVFTGSKVACEKKYTIAQIINYKNNYIYPGFNDAHCHFFPYAQGLGECNLIGTKSVNEIISRLKKYAKNNSNSWIIGRGWDQNDWKNKEFPDLELLDKYFPNTPVFLKRIDGHAAWINAACIKQINLDIHKKIEGGELLFKNGKFTGILVDNAIDLVSKYVPETKVEQKIANIQKAATNCYKAGITSITEAGFEVKNIGFTDTLQKNGLLYLRLYLLLSANDETMTFVYKRGIIKNEWMHIAGVKFYLDGALGSRGALLTKDYCDRLGHKGLLLQDPAQFRFYCNYLFTNGYQVAVHAIGDSANKIAIDIIKEIFQMPVDLRWRIEHAQIVDTSYLKYFNSRFLIPSVQPTHATSDAPWALQRICGNMVLGAYAYKSLLNTTGILPLGTDFPVEDISPIKTFYSAIERKDLGGNLSEPFLINQALSRVEALRGMTIWPAYAAFEENEKGSLEANKFADFVVLSDDIITCKSKKIKKVKVKATYINGKKVY